MAHDHRGNWIADPFINARAAQLNDLYESLHLMRPGLVGPSNNIGPRHTAEFARNLHGLASSDSPSLEGRSNMIPAEEMDYDSGLGGYDHIRGNVTDADLMPEGERDNSYTETGSSLPIDTAVRAFQESGHGFSIHEGRRGQ